MFKKQCKKTKMKAEASNNLTRKQAGRTWDATVNAIQTTVISILFFRWRIRPVWNQLKCTHSRRHSFIMRPIKVISRCLKPTPLKDTYFTCIERTKQTADQICPLCGYIKERRGVLNLDGILSPTQP